MSEEPGYGTIRVEYFMPNYRRLASRGGGGFGEVFVCQRDTDNETFAMKVLLPDQDDDTVKRFKREVRLLSSLDHPNVVKVVDMQLDTKRLSYVMPLYATSLDKELEGIAGDEGRIAKIFTSILDAVVYAHAEGVIHRDLKPGNILMNHDGDLVVSDFGLGRRLDSKSLLTTSKVGIGTPLYTAPEQWTDLKNVDERTDVFSLGRILLVLYTGSQAPTQDLSQLPDAIALVVNRCTQPDPARRFPSVVLLKKAFVSLADSGHPQGELQELLALRAQFSIPGDHVPEDLDRFILLLAKHHDKEEDLLHQTLMAVHADVIGVLLKTHFGVMKGFLDQFLTDAAGRSWGFSYTDKIAGQCKTIFEVTDDPEVRAALAVTVGIIGVGHNRWYVIGVARDLLQGEKTPAERMALVAQLEGLDNWLKRQLGESLMATQLDPALLPLLKPDAEEDI